MIKYPLSSSHLNYDRKRLKQFKKDRKKLESSVGNKTCLLMDLPPNNSLGGVRFANPVISQINNNSQYLLLLGLISKALKYGYNTIGRSSSNDLMVDNTYVSRTHCSLLVHSDGRVELFDTASLNGTYVNGIKVEQAWLNPGDIITIGETNIVISIGFNSCLN